MITLAAVLTRVPGLNEQQLRVWMAEEWVRPQRRGGEWMFAEIDLARVELIRELHELEVGSGAMPVVLSLLDQLHEQRRQMRRVAAALERAGVTAGQLGLP